MSVVAQDPYELGRRAGELLFARGDEPRRVVVPTQLITRGSGEIAPVVTDKRPLRSPRVRTRAQVPPADDERRRRGRGRQPQHGLTRRQRQPAGGPRAGRRRSSARSSCSATGHNHTAGSLRRADRQSASLGLILEDVANPFFSAVHRGVEEVARARSVVTFAGSSDEDPERERELIEAVLARRVDGLIVIPTGDDYSYLLRDVAAGVGVVFVDRPPVALDADCVLSEDRAGAERAVAHLLAHGHRRIGFVGYPPSRFTRRPSASRATAPRWRRPGSTRSSSRTRMARQKSAGKRSPCSNVLRRRCSRART